jgi:AcrR family transcriptional regulator
LNRRKTPPSGEYRDRILEAAIALISEKGVSALTHRDIALKADVPLASTTYYFASKNDLIVAAYMRNLERLQTETAHAIECQPGPMNVGQYLAAFAAYESLAREENRRRLQANLQLAIAAARTQEMGFLVREARLAEHAVVTKMLGLATSADADLNADMLLAASVGRLLMTIAFPSDAVA